MSTHDQQEHRQDEKVGKICGAAFLLLAGVAAVVAGQTSGTRSPDVTTVAYLALAAWPAIAGAGAIASAVATGRAYVGGRASDPPVRHRAIIWLVPLVGLGLMILTSLASDHLLKCVSARVQGP